MNLFNRTKQFVTWWETLTKHRDFYERAVARGLPLEKPKDTEALRHFAIAEGKLVIVWQAITSLMDVYHLPPTDPKHASAADAFVNAIRLNIGDPYCFAWESVLYRTPKGKVLQPFDGLPPNRKTQANTWNTQLIDDWLIFATKHTATDRMFSSLIGTPLTWDLYQLRIGFPRQRALFSALRKMRAQLLSGVPVEALDATDFWRAWDMTEGLTMPEKDAPEAARREFEAHKGKPFTLSSLPALKWF